MAEPDYYALIGVERNATLHEIRSKFRQKVLAEHPDKGGDPKKFQLLNKAYNILTDAEKRKRYDATGRTEVSAEEEFAASFGGGRMRAEERSKDADAKAVVNINERITQPGSTPHEDGFQEWLRQRDQAEMVMTDKDFMKTALFNAADMVTKVNHQGSVQHVLGSPKTDGYGQPLSGAVKVQTKPRPLKKTMDHDEILVRMLACPVDDSMVYAELDKTTGVCLGMTGVGRIEQVGARVEDVKQEDAVIVLPKPTKFSQQRPIGTARTLLICHEEDVIRVGSEILEELTPEQICLAPTIVTAYTLLEVYGAKLKPGDSVLMNAAHRSACGSALLQLCKLLKLKPLCILELSGAPKHRVKGEYGSKTAWQDADSRAVPPPSVRQQYERISEWLITMGAEEVFADAVGLLRWRDRNQRMLPKLALDGIATRDSAEQLIHCLQPGSSDPQVVVYGHGVSQPIEINPPLLAAWGGSLIGFNIYRWVHALTANEKKMMAVMENITKLVRANKFTLDTVLYKVGEDAIGDAFSRQADASDSSQVVLIFPTLQEETANAEGGGAAMSQRKSPAADTTKSKEEEEREKLKAEWIGLLFTENSVAAKSPEGPLPITLEIGNSRQPSTLVLWMGDNPDAENPLLRGLSTQLGPALFIGLSWSKHDAGEGLAEFNVLMPEVCDGTFYAREKHNFENEDLDMLHDVELLARSMVDAVEAKLSLYSLTWSNVVVTGFGKGAGIALYASLLRIIPQQVPSMILFNAIVPFPAFLGEKIQALRRGTSGTTMKLFPIWGAKDRSTPSNYRQLLTQTLRKVQDVQCTAETLDNDHTFDGKCMDAFPNLLQICLPR